LTSLSFLASLDHWVVVAAPVVVVVAAPAVAVVEIRHKLVLTKRRNVPTEVVPS